MISENVKVVDPVDLIIGAMLKRVRLERGVSRHALGQQLTVSHHQVRRYEEGESGMACSALHKAAIFVGLPIDAFFPTIEAFNGRPLPVSVESIGFLKVFECLSSSDQQLLLQLIRTLARSP